ncbi:hypothetical protein TWF696_003513 [Orbilia brochopaga]|uniref:CENP-V/GFA domain-containing protein n=1 Tax=Orbilia brochopaga TaxID=3140254 RepID=A0AAV9TYV8_9PEZI
MTTPGSPTLKLACHCGANTYSFPVTLPLDKKYKDIHLCLCSDCRWQTGNVAGSFIHAPNPPFDPEGSPPATLTAYKSSDVAARYFCSTCSSQLFLRYNIPELTQDTNNGFWLASGVVELPPGETFSVPEIIFGDSVGDGGMASLISDIKVCRTLEDALTPDDIAAKEKDASSLDVPQKLEGKCHCSSVKITLSRQTGQPEELPPNTFSSNTDLVIPNYTPADQQPPIDEKKPWWIRDEQVPGRGHRFLGGLCTCDSCRTIAGGEVQSWVFVPSVCIELTLPSGETVPWPGNEELADNKKYSGVIGTYKSTPGDPGVLRGFCRTCGANIFWDGLTRRNFVDLSAGLFTQRGVREEAWIEWWTERVSYVEDSERRHDLGKRLEKGLKDWKARLGGRA